MSWGGETRRSRSWSRRRMGKAMKGAELYRLLGALALGQFASLLITFTGLTSSILARQGINAPTSQSLLNYLLAAGFYGVIFLCNKKPLQVRWYYYLLLALMDVEGNYFVVKAYQYTSMTSVMLLDCWTIPCVLLLTWLFIKTKYNVGQLIGVCVCVLGLVLVILSDVHANDRSGGSNAILGDALVFIGATLYALTNVSEEFIIKKVDFVELMTFLGLFGSLISACQVAILEQRELAEIAWTRSAILPFVGYAVSLFLFYSTVPFILKLSGSALLNLSLLTSDMWAVAIRIFAYHQLVDWLFYVAFATVAVGIVIYSGSGRSSDSPLRETVAAEEIVYKRVDTTADEHEKDPEALSTSSKDTAETSSKDTEAPSTSITTQV
eukprot:c17958_g1_i1 orf=276-1418(-)